MECLGIDYGERRIGLAWGNQLGVATPIAAAVEETLEQRLQHIAAEISRRRIDRLVVGYPYNMNGSVGFKAREVDAFIATLEERFKLPVERIDERLTSQRATADMGMRLKDEQRLRKKGVVDSAAACLLLQDWLDMHVAAPAPDVFAESEFDD